MEWLVRGGDGNGQLCLNLIPPIISKNMVELRAMDQKSRDLLLQVKFGDFLNANLLFSFYHVIHRLLKKKMNSAMRSLCWEKPTQSSM